MDYPSEEEVVEGLENTDVEQSTEPQVVNTDAEVTPDTGTQEDTQQPGPIPYERFQEVNDKYRDLETRYGEMESDLQRQMQEQVAQRDQQWQDYIESIQPQDDPMANLAKDDFLTKEHLDHQAHQYQSQIQSLQKQLHEVSVQQHQGQLERELEQLRQKYPEMNRDAVLAQLHFNPKASLQQLVKNNHTANEKALQARFKAFVERKKQGAATIKGKHTPQLPKAPKYDPGNPNKVWDDASAAAEKWLEGLDTLDNY